MHLASGRLQKICVVSAGLGKACFILELRIEAGSAGITMQVCEVRELSWVKYTQLSGFIVQEETQGPGPETRPYLNTQENQCGVK